MAAIRTGCKLRIEKPYYKGSFRKPKYIGKAVMEVDILRHSYGSEKGQHTFTCLVADVLSVDPNVTPHTKGDTFRVKGRNLYPNVLHHKQGVESLRDT